MFKTNVMKKITTQFKSRFTPLIMLLTCSISLLAQREVKAPNYLGEQSLSTLNDVQNSMNTWRNDKGRNPIENIIGVASDDFREISNNGVENANTIEQLMGVPADQLAEIDEIVSTEILNNTEVVLNEEELEFAKERISMFASLIDYDQSQRTTLKVFKNFAFIFALQFRFLRIF